MTVEMSVKNDYLGSHGHIVGIGTRTREV
eukprot:COSAG02_NODE_17757_length_983_cov_1.392534_2_plen_28_part_01